MSDYIPDATSVGLQELLLGCLNNTPEKRMPSAVMISSPWFQSYGIANIDDAASIMHLFGECISKMIISVSFYSSTRSSLVALKALTAEHQFADGTESAYL